MVSRKGSLEGWGSSKRIKFGMIKRKSTRVFNLNPSAIVPHKIINTGNVGGPIAALIKDPNSKKEFNPTIIRKLQAQAKMNRASDYKNNTLQAPPKKGQKLPKRQYSSGSLGGGNINV